MLNLVVKNRLTHFFSFENFDPKNGFLMMWLYHMIGNTLDIMYVNVHEASIVNDSKNMSQMKKGKRGITAKTIGISQQLQSWPRKEYMLV